ncbi:MAG: type 1 glutamine amidotransferase [Pseudomonadota bacterium]
MKPVAICRYAAHEGPGYFATYLSNRKIPWRVVKIDEGETLPAVGEISGLAMMGGAMSVNDELPWIAPMLELVRQSVRADVPVIGHCLGGQMLAKALGARVTANPVKEIGWGRVEVSPTPLAHRWGPAESFTSFHWHGETFELPVGATRIWSSAHCANQAFVLGYSIGMQCHVEMTQEMIEAWCKTGRREIERSVKRSPVVQTVDEISDDMPAKLQSLHTVADSVYTQWIAGLERA